MLEDAALFKYELAITVVIKNELLYIKEWIEYHLLAGVDHFYIYDNDSTDNIREFLQSYIDSGVVDYDVCPGRCSQMLAFNNAIQKYKYDCKYMLFIDIDEFVFPHENKSILEIANDYFQNDPVVAGFSMNCLFFGSSGHEKADFSKDVVERFVHRSNTNFPGNKYLKTIINPRCVKLMQDPHNAVYYDGKCSIREDEKLVISPFAEPVVANKISINHYQIKSREEYIIRHNKSLSGDVYYVYQRERIENIPDEEWNQINEGKNEVFDDGILSYRSSRQEIQDRQGSKYESIQQINQRRFNALIRTLSPLILSANLSLFDDENGVFSGKIHLFLTCWAVSRDLKAAGLSEQDVSFLEELSLKCLYKSILSGSLEICQLQLLIDELPKILSCKYSIVNDIKEIVISIIPQFMNYRRMQNNWQSYKKLEYLLEMLNI